MQALAASCEELRARTGNPPLIRDSNPGAVPRKRAPKPLRHKELAQFIACK